ncbi:MAG: superoxide dismutase [Cu-Zn] SodC [Gammaproteobacteria bacterium]|jgi:Cu-Zn family superoxide dismutase|nr:superoxide dismutase [Cu-Zn] SodC [Gammaproteobacteria bacterium]
MKRRIGGVLVLLAVVGPAAAVEGIDVAIHAVDASGVGKELGTVHIAESAHGLVFTPELRGLPAGLHGFHVHQNPDCAPAEKDGKMSAAEAAGGHFDPDKRGRHGAPWGDGHAGDLPALYVDKDGNALHSVLAPRLELDDVRNRALMIHEGGDNYADEPTPLGGGGKRIACGVVR